MSCGSLGRIIKDIGGIDNKKMIKKIKDNQPKFYNDIIGTWYIFSNDDAPNTIHKITFSEDSKVTGDLKQFTGENIISWTPMIKTKDTSFIRGYFCLEDKNKKKIFIKYLGLNNQKDSINKRYKKTIPPLKVLSVSNTIYNFRDKKHFVFSKNKEDIIRIQNKILLAIKLENKKWNEVDENSMKSLVSILKNSHNIDHRKKALEMLKPLLDDKVKLYINKKYPHFSKYINSTIYYKDGTKSFKFYQILRKPIISIFPHSGYKVKFSIFKSSEGITLKIGKNEFYFNPYKKNLTIVGCKIKWLRNPRNWEYIFATLVKQTSTFPSTKYIDLELLEKL